VLGGGLDLTAEDLTSWAERRLEQDARQAMLAQARMDTPQTPPVSAEAAAGVATLSEELLDMLAEIAPEVIVILPPMFGHAYAKLAGADTERQLSPEAASKIRGSIAMMPDQMQEGFMSWLKAQGNSPVSWEKAQELAAHIAEKRSITDPERFGAWLYWASKV